VFVGVQRWQGRIWHSVLKLMSHSNSTASENSTMSADELRKIEFDISQARNIALKEASDWN